VSIESKPTSGFLSVAEAALLLGVSYGSVLAAIHAGCLLAFRFGARGGTYRIKRSDLEDYIGACSTRKTTPREKKAKKSTGTFKKLDSEKLLKAWQSQGISPLRSEEAAE
jgi:excisionase family DNA binding protein